MARAQIGSTGWGTGADAVRCDPRSEPAGARLGNGGRLNELVNRVDLRFRPIVQGVLWHLVLREASTEDLELLLDVLEKYQHLVSVHYVPPAVKVPHASWRGRSFYGLVRFIEAFRIARPELWTEQHWQRYWQLARWTDEGVPEGTAAISAAQK